MEVVEILVLVVECAGTHEDMKEYSPSSDRPQAQVSTSAAQRLKSKFEAKQKGSQYPQSAPERTQVPTAQKVQKTVEVPRVQYIDKVVDTPAEAARQDTQHENKKRKTLVVNNASGGEAEDESENESATTQCPVRGEESTLTDETDAQGSECEMVMHAEWVQDLRDVKNELTEVRELVGILVRRERSAETKAEIAARRLDRMEREQHEVDDAEHEANLQEALTNQSKAVKVLVDKWFVDKGYGFGKAPTGEIVFIHSSALQGAEVLTIGTDAWVQVVNDDARAQGEYRARKAWGRDTWKAERDKQKANKVAKQVKGAAALTAELAAQSEKKTAAVCDQPPGLDELAWLIGGSHPQATMMPDPWATYKCPSRKPILSQQARIFPVTPESSVEDKSGLTCEPKKQHP